MAKAKTTTTTTPPPTHRSGVDALHAFDELGDTIKLVELINAAALADVPAEPEQIAFGCRLVSERLAKTKAALKKLGEIDRRSPTAAND